ncbi:MAG: hypothetical protein ABR879_03085 [Methanomassiliicoccales archaeon]
MTSASVASFKDLGVLSKGSVSLILLQIVVLACMVGASSWISLTDKDGLFGKRSRFSSTLSFAVGVVLSSEGIVAIALNGSIVTGTTPGFMIVVGLELYALGILSMISFVQNEDRPSERGTAAFISIIVFILMMLLPAFLMVNG